MSTFGEVGYDFQGVGEFVLARSADGRFEVQARQSRLGTSKAVSINTALAVRAGDHRLALYIDVDASTVRMTVDGADVPIVEGSPVSFGAGTVVPGPEGFSIDSGDGSQVYVVGMNYRGFSLLVEPGDARRDGIVGLMGANPFGSRWPALPDGSAILPVPQGRHDEYQQLYVTLADAWRVTGSTSLFDYGPGASTETFNPPNVPAEADLVYLEDLSPVQLAAGEDACRSVADEALHKMCVYDVGITADSGYAGLYEAQVTLLEAGQLGRSGERLRIVNLYANEGVPTALDVYAWAGDATNLGTNSGTGPALVTTVEYGAVSAWFDPGRMANGPFAPVNWLTVQRHGEAVNDWRFNLLDLPRDSLDGLDRTILLTADPDAFSIVGGTEVTYGEIAEESPEGFPLIDPPAGKALGFLDIQPMDEIRNGVSYAASSDGRCLTDPDFPTLARVAQGVRPFPLLIEPGTHRIAVHEWQAGGDDFDLNCARIPAAANTTVSLAAGDRVLLFVFAERVGAPIHLLAVPVGD